MKLGEKSIKLPIDDSEKEKLKEDIETSGMCVYLMIYGEHCGHCVNAMPDWIKFENHLKNDEMASAWAIEAGALKELGIPATKLGNLDIMAVPEFRHIHVGPNSNTVKEWNSSGHTLDNFKEWYNETKHKQSQKGGGKKSGCGCGKVKFSLPFMGGKTKKNGNGKGGKAKRARKAKKSKKSKKGGAQITSKELASMIVKTKDKNSNYDDFELQRIVDQYLISGNLKYYINMKPCGYGSVAGNIDDVRECETYKYIVYDEMAKFYERKAHKTPEEIKKFLWLKGKRSTHYEKGSDLSDESDDDYGYQGGKRKTRRKSRTAKKHRKSKKNKKSRRSRKSRKSRK